MSDYIVMRTPTLGESLSACKYIGATNWLYWGRQKAIGFFLVPICDTDELNLGEIITLMTWDKCAFVEAEPEEGAEYGKEDFDDEELTDEEISGKSAQEVKAEIAAGRRF